MYDNQKREDEKGANEVGNEVNDEVEPPDQTEEPDVGEIKEQNLSKDE